MDQSDQTRQTTDVSVIIPAYQEQGIIGDTVKGVIQVMDNSGLNYEVIVVDDGSSDKTQNEAEKAGAQVITHPYNIGNGAAVKTGIRNSHGDVLVFLDGDGQHHPEDIPLFLEALKTYDMVVGARTKDSKATYQRKLANRIYNGIASYVSGRKIQDLTSGFRAIRGKIARELLPLLPNTFSYPTTITLAVVRSGYSLSYVPIQTSWRVGKSKIRHLADGSRFLLIIFKITTLYSPMKIFLPISILTFLTGVGYGFYRVLFLDTRYGPTSAMLISVSILMFLIGLVSEQIAQLRFDRSDK
jgi:glycosyltransferase involved in cell wall biosynthesis